MLKKILTYFKSKQELEADLAHKQAQLFLARAEREVMRSEKTLWRSRALNFDGVSPENKTHWHTEGAITQ